MPSWESGFLRVIMCLMYHLKARLQKPQNQKLLPGQLLAWRTQYNHACIHVHVHVFTKLYDMYVHCVIILDSNLLIILVASLQVTESTAACQDKADSVWPRPHSVSD